MSENDNIPNEENLEEQEENILEEFTDMNQFRVGISQASFLSGFAYVFKKMGFSDTVIGSIINQKMVAEYQMEVHRLTIQAQENLNEKILEAKIENGFFEIGE